MSKDFLKEDLAVWFGTKKKSKGSKQPQGPWVNICRKDKKGKHPPVVDLKQTIKHIQSVVLWVLLEKCLRTKKERLVDKKELLRKKTLKQVKVKNL
jgi:hypothetical protein